MQERERQKLKSKASVQMWIDGEGSLFVVSRVEQNRDDGVSRLKVAETVRTRKVRTTTMSGLSS